MSNDAGSAPKKIVWKIPSAAVEFKPLVKVPEVTPLITDSAVPLQAPAKTPMSKKEKKRQKQRDRRSQPTRTPAAQPKTEKPRLGAWPREDPTVGLDEFDEPPSPETIRMNKIKEELYRPYIELKDPILVSQRAFMEWESEVAKLRVRPSNESNEFIPEMVKFIKILSEIPCYGEVLREVNPEYLQMLDDLDPSVMTPVKRASLKAISCRSIITLFYDDLEYTEDLVYSPTLEQDLAGIPWDRFWALEISHADDSLYQAEFCTQYSAWHCECCRSLSNPIVSTSFNAAVCAYIAKLYLGKNVFDMTIRCSVPVPVDDSEVIDYLSRPTYFDSLVGLHLKLFHTSDNLERVKTGAVKTRRRQPSESAEVYQEEDAYLDKIYAKTALVEKSPAFSWLSSEFKAEHGLKPSYLGKLDLPITLHPLCRDHRCSSRFRILDDESAFACDLTMEGLIRERLPCLEFGQCPRDSPIITFSLQSVSGREKDKATFFQCCSAHEERMRREIESSLIRKAELKREKAQISVKLTDWRRSDPEGSTL